MAYYHCLLQLKAPAQHAEQSSRLAAGRAAGAYGAAGRRAALEAEEVEAVVEAAAGDEVEGEAYASCEAEAAAAVACQRRVR